MRKTLGLLFLFALAASTIVAADFYKGVAAYKRGEFAAACREWLPLAAEGDPEAQYRLARMYYRGEIEQDDSQALRWYRAAAKFGHAMAQNNLGLMYEEGRGGEIQPDEAVLWYRKAAGQSLPTAQFNLARAYQNGFGVEANGGQALRWYRLAAEQGHLNSQIRLSTMYDRGEGVAPDPKLAAKWYREAAKQGHGPSQGALGAMYDAGRGVERNPKKAAKWHGRASAQGIFPATPRLPTTSIERPETTRIEPAADPSPVVQPEPVATPPVVTTPDPVPEREPVVPTPETLPVHEPVATPEPAAMPEAADAESLYRRAQMYNAGQGVPRSLTEAGRWYREAAEKGHEMAGYRLAFLYLKGHVNSTRDYVEAHKWFSLSAQRGIGDAGEWRDKIAKKMTREELDRSARLVQDWEPRD